jgi:hypothetical protein
MRSQAEALLACDFLTADLLNGTQAYVLAVIEHATRRILIWNQGHLRRIWASTRPTTISTGLTCRWTPLRR